MYDLASFTLGDMTTCGMALRKLGQGATTMEEAAHNIVRYFYEQFVDPITGQGALALVRCFKTHTYSELNGQLQQQADRMLGQLPAPAEMKCLVLLATAGDQPAWNQRSQSIGHQAIPLPSEQMVAQAPMISQLIQQLGLSISHVLAPAPELLIDLQERTYNVFHIPNATNSPYIPAQAEFVKPFQIKSILGFGGILPSGNLLVVILFSKVAIDRNTAELFKPLALNAKMALLPFDRQAIFLPSRP